MATHAFLCNIDSFSIKGWKHKVNSGNREKVTDHFPYAFIYFVYQKKNEWTMKKVYRCQICYYYRKSQFSKPHID